jgi:hypothetical protein
MNKLKAVIHSLKKDMDNIDIDKIVELYSENEPVAEIAHQLNRTTYEINKVLYALQLRRKKRHRQADYRMYQIQLSDSNDTVIEIDNLQKELDFAYKALDTVENRLTLTKLESKKLKRTQRINSTVDAIQSEILTALLSRLQHEPLLHIEYSPIIRSSSAEVQDNGLLAVMGDLHLGEVINTNEVPNNKYNYEVAKARIDTFLDNIIMYPRQSANLTLVDLKDNIKGVIHGGMFNTEGGFITSIIEAVKLNVYVYSTLAHVYDTLTVYTTGSNHERLTDFIVADGKYMDYGRLIDSMTNLQLEAMGLTNINIVTTDFGLNMFNINGANIVAFHGDNIRTYRPYDSNQRALLQDLCLSTLKTTYRHAINGHGHQFMMCHNQYNGMTIQNGTTVGANAYGLQNGMRYLTPSQTIAFVELDGSIQDVRALDLLNQS